MTGKHQERHTEQTMVFLASRVKLHIIQGLTHYKAFETTKDIPI